jgi:hypothetical protein
VQIAAIGDDPRFVERRPLFHATVELAVDDARVVGEPVRDVGIQPAAAIVERGGKIPVIQRRQWLDAVLE